MRSGVYRIRNTVTGESYVGAAANVVTRYSAHLALLRSGNHSCQALQESFIGYGPASFALEVLERCPAENLKEREAYWMSLEPRLFNRDTMGRGRPPGSGLQGEMLRCQISPEMMERIEQWRQARGLPNMSEAIRRIMERGLGHK